MSNNITQLRDHNDPVRTARATYVHGELKGERWSIRQAALAIGVTHTVLGSRLKGETPFTGEELERVATLLKRDPVGFYAEYLSVGPAGFEPATSTVKTRKSDHLARVTPIRTAVAL